DYYCYSTDSRSNHDVF
nr:immunoglobulin light chain junction region [Macaca mulatta]